MKTLSDVTLSDVVELLKKKGYEAEWQGYYSISIANANCHDLCQYRSMSISEWSITQNRRTQSAIITYQVLLQPMMQHIGYNESIRLLYDWVRGVLPDRDVLKSNPDYHSSITPNPFGQIHDEFTGDLMAMAIIDDIDRSSMYPIKPIAHDYLPGYTGESSESIIASISDSDGNLNVNAAKAKFGSCKKALKAIVKACRMEQKCQSGNKEFNEKMAEFYNKKSQDCEQ